jgi:hypothetical protein
VDIGQIHHAVTGAAEYQAEGMLEAVPCWPCSVVNGPAMTARQLREVGAWLAGGVMASTRSALGPPAPPETLGAPRQRRETHPHWFPDAPRARRSAESPRRRDGKTSGEKRDPAMELMKKQIRRVNSELLFFALSY